MSEPDEIAVKEETGQEEIKEEVSSDDEFPLYRKKDKKDRKDKKKRRRAASLESVEVKSEIQEDSPARKKKKKNKNNDDHDLESVEVASDTHIEKEVSKQIANADIFDEDEENAAWNNVLDRLNTDHDADDDLTAVLKKESAGDAATEEKKPANKQIIDSITLTRNRDISPHCQLFFFQKLVSGAFVRVVIDTKTPHHTYALFEVETAVPSGTDQQTGAALTYKVNDTLTDWIIVCRSGRHQRRFKLSSVSNEKCTEEEYLDYVKRMARHQIPVITRKRAAEKRSQLWKIYSDYYKKPLTDEQVKEIVDTRKRLRGKASVNLVKNKIILQKELEELAVRRIQEEDMTELPPEYKAVEEELGLEVAWKKFFEDPDIKKRQLEAELQETEEKLKSVLYGQNSSFSTLATLTHRNAAANKGRVEATDPIDTIVFGRKEGRSGKSYWSVSEGGFAEKKQEIDTFWVDKKKQENDEQQEIQVKRAKELKIGTVPIKDLESFTHEVASTPLEAGSASSMRTPSKPTQNPAAKKARVQHGGTTTKMSLSEFLKRKKEAKK
eukprot:TRINITY_DN17873_c0_g1_i1.p1 TRINITY_DN17873_c0_g1~~TRINITY_DN17873_c0_g1_i1.p1  ORF type:complete len:569 (+),score=173.83 TRINITY_DN17873_c0_g1_i1:50-1708(+)